MIKLYGITAIARELHVTPQAVFNWRSRYGDTPAASHSCDDRIFWDEDGLAAWFAWWRATFGKGLEGGRG